MFHPQVGGLPFDRQRRIGDVAGLGDDLGKVHRAAFDETALFIDLARLGNLLKLALDEPLSADLLRKYDDLAATIKSTQDELKDVVRKIDRTIGRGAK